MKIIFSPRYCYLLLLMFHYVSLHALSEIERAHLRENRDEVYMYCDKNHSKIAEFITEISTLDQDTNSPVWKLRRHIENGFSIGRQDAVMNALEHAEKTLERSYNYLSKEKIKQIQAIISSIVETVSSGKLIVPNSQSSSVTKNVSLNHDHELMRAGEIKITRPVKFFKHVKFKEDVKFHDEVKFEDKVKFEEDVKFVDEVKFEDNALFGQNVEIQGSLSVSDETIGCDLTVGCNINMNDSSGNDIGNIIKNGQPFIHNAGTNNTFVGSNSGNFLMGGQANSGFGAFTLSTNQNGFYNVALGFATLNTNQNGSVNTAVGSITLVSNSSGDANTAVGFLTMPNNSSGSGNTAIGIEALFSNSSGDENTVLGAGALDSSTTGSRNIAIGVDAGSSLVTGSDNIYIGADGATSESGIIRIGTSSTHTEVLIQGIFGQATALGGLSVEVDITGKLGTVVSSETRKRNIATMNEESQKIYDLRPVTFSYKSDETNTKQYGLIAEEVAEILPSLIVYDKEGHPYSVRYQVLPVLLLNEIQKQQTIIEAEIIARQALAERVALLEAHM